MPTCCETSFRFSRETSCRCFRKNRVTLRSSILSSLLSGPIDVDKMDYLMRDSLHAGVPYGRNFDQQRLIGSLCLNRAGDGVALSDKGRTAAEMMVFSRYVMFSEVYWHHAVRAATAMFQRAFFLLHEDLQTDLLFRMNEPRMISALREIAELGPRGRSARRSVWPHAAAVQATRRIQLLSTAPHLRTLGPPPLRLVGRLQRRLG